ncbi:hypothetical protein [Nostoc sp. CALU 546]|uniref:hypothetical protein n=1 Tax=Nostoc sp. CALU 546 TaxID=1867241 RepID=UPI003B66CDA2
MEPISLIITALSAGAIAASKDIAGTAVKDAYQELKKLIKKRFEGDLLGQAMVDAKPEEIKQAEGLLKDKIVKEGVDKDAEIQKIAEELMELLKSEQSGSASSNTTNIQAKNVVSQIGDHGIQKDIKFN